ncbi:MAG: hypothetical protein ACRDLU_00695 [Gaiellaceae bacterium]
MPKPLFDELETKLGQHPGRGAPPSELKCPREHRPPTEERREEHELRRNLVQRGALERAGDHPGEEARLEKHEDRRRYAERDVGAQQPARCMGATEQARI